jgi:hypothetical protein
MGVLKNGAFKKRALQLYHRRNGPPWMYPLANEASSPLQPERTRRKGAGGFA